MTPDEQEKHYQYRMAVRAAVMRLALTCEPDGQYDPADDPRPVDAVQNLTLIVDSVDIAQGIQEALRELWARWYLDAQG